MLVNLIEEAYLLHENEKKKSSIARKWDNTGNDSMRLSGIFELIPGHGATMGRIARLYSGLRAGEAVGHPNVGALGREAALGAVSKHNDNVSLSDVYTKNNMINRGMVSAGVLGSLFTAGEVMNNDPTAILDTDAGKFAAGYALASPTIIPAISYGLGKVFGSKKPDYSDPYADPKLKSK